MSAEHGIKVITPREPDLEGVSESLSVHTAALVNGDQLEAVTISNLDTTPAPIRASDLAVYQSTIQGTRLLSSTLPGVRFTDCAFDRADLSGATWTDARLTRVRWTSCKLTGFDASDATITDAHFKDCKAPDVLLNGANLTRVVFEGCQLTTLDFTDATIHSAGFRGCDLRNLRLISARIDHLDLRGSNIEGIALHESSLAGLIIDPTQAPAIAEALGVRIADLNA